MAYTIDKKSVVNYPPEEIRKFRIEHYEYIDNLHFMIAPSEFLDNAEAYISVVRELFLEAGWEGDGEIKLLWIPPFCIETDDTMWEYPQGEVIWHTKQKSDGISWLAIPEKLVAFMAKAKSPFNEKTMNNPTNLYDLLRQMKLRFGMYIQPQTLWALQNFINGYQTALHTHQIVENGFIDKEFADFVAQKYGFYESTAGYVNMILAVVTGFDPKNMDWDKFGKHIISEAEHQQSIDLFFNILDEFINKK